MKSQSLIVWTHNDLGIRVVNKLSELTKLEKDMVKDISASLFEVSYGKVKRVKLNQ